MPDTSQKRRLANAHNATHSTGPKTVAGKARSSKNALKHGLTSRDAVLPNEDPAAFAQNLHHWLEFYQPQDPAQAAMIERAVVSKWKLDRCTRVETERLSEKVRHADDQFDLDRFTAAEELGRRLINDPINRSDTPKLDDPAFRAKMGIRIADNPAILTRQLQMTSQGADWLIRRWGELAETLQSRGFWHYPEKFRALWLLGKNPADAMNDPLVQDFFLACDAAHPDLADTPQHRNLWDECYQAKTFVHGQPAYFHHLDGLPSRRPVDAPTAQARLREMMTQELTRLGTRKRTHLDPLDRLDRASAQQRAMFDDSKEGVLLRRYETACEKEFHKSIADLLKLRKEPTPTTDTDAPLPNEPIAETPEDGDFTSNDLAASRPEPADFVPSTPVDDFVTPSAGLPGVETIPGTAL